MDRREATETAATIVAVAISAAGESPASVAKATGIPLEHLNHCLEGTDEFTVTDLGNVGGFLHVSPARFLEGVAA